VNRYIRPSRLVRVVLLASFSSLVACSGSDGAPVSDDMRPSIDAAPIAHYAVATQASGELRVARLGASVTVCLDGVARTSCPLAAIDLDRADLRQADAASTLRSLAGGAAIASGRLVRDLEGDGARLVVSSVWSRRSAAATVVDAPAPASGMFFLRDDSGACASDVRGCAWLRAEPVGSSDPAVHVGGLELSAIGAELDGAEREALERGTLLAAGARVGRAFVAVSLWVPVGPTPLQ
jgi:hypothetical protein